MKVNVDRLIDFVVEWYVNNEDYMRTSHLPYSHGVHRGSVDGFDKRRDELRSKCHWTNWEHCLSADMLDKIGNYIFD